MGLLTLPELPAGRSQLEAHKSVPSSAEDGKGYAPLTAPPFEKGGRKLFRCFYLEFFLSTIALTVIGRPKRLINPAACDWS